MAKEVLRLGKDGEITHQYLTTRDGKRVYLHVEDMENINNVSSDAMDDYYSGDPFDEIESLKDDIRNLFNGIVDVNLLKLRVLTYDKNLKHEIVEL